MSSNSTDSDINETLKSSEKKENQIGDISSEEIGDNRTSYENQNSKINDNASQQSSDPISSSCESFRLDENWDIFYDKLVAYKQKHGHCIIPQSYEEDPELAQWVFEQRVKGQAKLDKDKVEKLTSISFEWYPPESNDQDKWHSMLNSLLEYKEKYGDCLVPQRYSDDPKLGRWVNKQRENKDRLLPERRKLLDDIDFTWKVVQREPWDNMYQRLIEYKRKHGDCLVPQRYKKDPRLGGWVREQRKRKSLMPADRKRRLDTIDFTWKAKQDPNESSNEPSSHDGIVASTAVESNAITSNSNSVASLAWNSNMIVPGSALPQQAATSMTQYGPTCMLPLNSNNGGLGLIALAPGVPAQYNLAAPPAAPTMVNTTATPSLTLPQIPLGTIIPAGGIPATVDASTAAAIRSLQAQNAIGQYNLMVANQQQTNAVIGVNQLAALQRQALQVRAAAGLANVSGGDANPLAAQIVQQQWNNLANSTSMNGALGLSAGGNVSPAGMLINVAVNTGNDSSQQQEEGQARQQNVNGNEQKPN